MPESKIQGSVKRIGRRITEIGGRYTISDLHEIDLQPSADQKADFLANPASYFERLLRQEGHPVQKVIIPKGADVTVKPMYWVHITDDERNPAWRCVWIWIEEDGGPSPY